MEEVVNDIVVIKLFILFCFVFFCFKRLMVLIRIWCLNFNIRCMYIFLEWKMSIFFLGKI